MSFFVSLCLIAQAVAASAPHASALALYQQHKYTEAATAFKEALKTENPGSREYNESLVLLSHSLFNSGRSAEAPQYLEKVTARTNEVLYMLGSGYLFARDYKRAEVSFSEMFSVDPASSAGHLVTAQMMMRADLADEAEKEAHAALDLDAKLPQVHFLLGEIALYHGQSDSAVTLLKQEIALNPDYAMTYFKLGDAYTRLSDWGAAVSQLQKSIWLNPDFSGPYILLGKSYLKLNQLGNAEGMLRRAVQLDPRNYSAHYMLGQTLIQEGRADEGRAMLQESQKLKQ